MVPKRGLEPPHLAALDPKSSVSTNSTTSAHFLIFNFNVYLLIKAVCLVLKLKIQIYYVISGAEGEIRTPTSVRSLVPETSASTNSATSAQSHFYSSDQQFKDCFKTAIRIYIFA